MKRTKRILAVFICAVMIMALIPAEIGSAVAMSGYTWTYNLTLKTKNTNKADSKDNIKIGIRYVDANGETQSTILQDVDGMGTNQTKSWSPTSTIAPWQITEFYVEVGTSNALCVEYLAASVKMDDWRSTGNVTLLSSYNKECQGWIGGEQLYGISWTKKNGVWYPSLYKIGGHPTERSATVTDYAKRSRIQNTDGIDGIATELNGTTVLNVQGESGKISVRSYCLIKDQFYNYQYGYNCFYYEGSPTVKITATAVGAEVTAGSNTSYKLSDLENDVGFKTYLGTSTDANNNVTVTGAGFEVDRAALLTYMNKKDINLITITTKLTFPKGRFRNNTDSELTLERTYTITRSVAAVGTPTYSNNYSKPTVDDNNRYYNNSTESVTVSIPISLGGNQNHLKMEIPGSTYNIFGRQLYYDSAKLLIGREEDGVYVTKSAGFANVNEKGNATMTFDLPDNVDSGTAGLTLILEGARLLIYSTNISSHYFYIYTPGATDNGTTDELKLGAVKAYNAVYKVDRIDPEITVKETDGGGEFKSWTNRMTVAVELSENLYKSTSTTKAGFTDPQFTYSLREEGKSESVKILNNELKGSSTSQMIRAASGGADTELIIALGDKAEGKYELVIEGKDRANNKVSKSFAGLWIDNKPPEVKMTEKTDVNRSTGILTRQYIFDATDLSMSGRSYYYIDTTGSGTKPTFNVNDATSSEEISGTIDNFNNRWIYIPQTDNDTSTTDGAFVITLAQGESYSGVMYYLGADGSGNVSDMNKVEIDLENTDLTCAVSYDVVGGRNDYEITLSAAAGTTISYRWLDSNEKEVAASTDYKEAFGGAWGEDEAWDGAYILEYTVKSTSLGTSQTGKETFVFDNRAPEITIEDENAETYDEIHVLSVDVSDTYAISEATGQYYTADGETEIGEEFSLIDEGANGAYGLSKTLLFGAENEVTSGAYILKITATDENGNTSERTSGVINVRNTPPEVTVTASADVTYGEDENGNAIPLVKGDGEYKVNVEIFESFINPELAPLEMGERQVVYYRVTDGTVSSTSNWTMLGELKASELNSLFVGEYEITNPAELVEGRNIVSMEFIVAAQGRSYYTSEDQLEIGENANHVAQAYFEIYCDKTAPTYSLTLEDTRTSENITGTLVLYDEYSPSFTWEASDEAVTLTQIITEVSDEEPSEESAEEETTEEETEAVEESEEGATEPDEEETDATGEEESEGGEEYAPYTTYKVTVSDNTSSILTITDRAGNKLEIPIEIAGIDREGPTAEITESESVVLGDRQDAAAYISVSDMVRSSFKLAVIPAAELSSAVTDGVINDEYFTNYADTITYVQDYEGKATAEDEINAVYEVYLAGDDGEYYIGVRAEDNLGNSRDTVFAESFEIIDAEAAVEVTKIAPKEAGQRAKVTIESNVPVYILPQSMITDEASEEVAEEEGDAIDNTNMMLAEKYASAFMTENTMVITDVGTYKLYVCDDLGRTSVHEIVIGDEDVSFGNGLEEPTVTTYITRWIYGYDENYDYVGEVEETEEVAEGEYAPSYEAYMDLGSYGEFAYANQISLGVIELIAADGTYLQPNDDEVVENGLYFSESDSDMGAHGYTRMVYYPEQIIEEESWTEKSVDVREIPIYICTDERYEVEDWYSTSVYVDNIDNTSPVTSVNYTPMLYDPINGDTAYTLGDVTIDVFMSDTESGMDYIRLYDYGTDTDYSISLKDDNGNMIDYYTTPYTVSNDLFDLELYSDTDPRTDKHLRITLHENAEFEFVVYNGAGMAQYGDNDGILRVENINKIPLSDEHYTLTYYGTDANGDWQVVDPEDDATFYREGKVVIEPTAAGNERGLYVANNGGSNERTLNMLGTSYTFSLKDQYGYTLDVDTEMTNFDVTRGELTWTLETEELTNSATVTITAYDAQSGVDNVTMAVGGTAGELVPISVDEDGLYTYQETLTKSGTYTVTLTDKVGNVTQEIFMVSSIDSEAPEIAGIVYTNTSLTDQPVVATITYTKKNVTLTTVEPSYEGFTDYEVDYKNSMIRFLDSGSVDVSFTDAYGNVGYGSVSVGNIYTIPPSLEAVMEVADDKQSVTVTFEKALDENLRPIDTMRELEDITVKYGGIARRAEWPDDEGNPVKAEFTFLENGSYQFEIYDDAWITTYMTIAITGIDTEAPQITQVSWSYNYDVVDENGNFLEMRLEEGQWVPGNEAGYMIFTDAHPITNYDVDVTVETDSETKISGKTDSTSSTTHTVTYDNNGSYIFNVEKDNGMLDSYGFEVGVIDKTAPVIELNATELLFYENTNMGVSYDRDLIDKGFTAYDEFRGEKKDLTSRVKIDYGNFDPNVITNNKYDRTIPYTITYSVTDDANNTTEARMTVRLVALTDTIVLVNGELPDSANRARIYTDEITLTLQNFSGIAYAKVATGAQTMGYMKTNGTVIEQTRDANGIATGEFTYTAPASAWYTILVQTDKRDYFNLQIVVNVPEEDEEDSE